MIDTVMGAVSVDNVSSGEPTLAADVCQSASRMRRNYGDAVAHLSTHNTQDHTHTYQHQRQAHQHSNTPQKQNMHQPQHGGWRRRRCKWRPCPECKIDTLRRPRVPHSQVWSCRPGALALVHLQEALTDPGVSASGDGALDLRVVGQVAHGDDPHATGYRPQARINYVCVNELRAHCPLILSG